MKIDMIAISLIMVVCVFLPFFLFPIIGMLGKTKLVKQFEFQATKRGLHIAHSEHWNLNHLGIDKNQNKLLFVQQRDRDFLVEDIDLHLVASCHLLPETQQVKNNGRLEERLQRIDLEFYMKQDGSRRLLSLYDYEHNYAQDLEMKHAENWHKIIQQQLLPNTMKRSA